MTEPSPNRAYRIIVGVLVAAILGIFCFAAALLVAQRLPTSAAVAATLTAIPRHSPTLTPTPTPVPTIPATNPELLLCQRRAGQAMKARNMVGAVNISGDHLFLLTWFSLDKQIFDLQDALPGLVMAYDVALELWEEDCALYDRVQVDVYDGPGDRQEYKLTVHTGMDDLLRWRAGELSDEILLERIEVIQPTPVP